MPTDRTARPTAVDRPAAAARVLLLAPTARDGELTRRLLAGASVECDLFEDVPALCGGAGAGAGLLMVPEEAVVGDGVDCLADHLRHQPIWSDLPVVVLSRAGGDTSAVDRALAVLGNVTVVERPVRVSTLLSTVRTALRARERQYQIRDHLAEQQRAARALAHSEAEFRQQADAMPQIVWAARPDGTVDYYNRRWFEYTGLADHGAVGEAGYEPALPPEDLARVRQVWPACVRTGRPYEMEYRFRRAGDGAYRWHLGRAVPIRDAAGQIIRWIGTNTDIHDQKVMAEQNARLLDSERAARAEAEALAAEAERQGRMKDEFLATLSHELRTPLNAILGWAQILRADGGAADPVDVAEGLASIERNARAQTQIIADLLDMSRVVSGKMHLAVEPVDPLGVVRAAADTVRAAAAAKRVTLDVAAVGPVPPMDGDPHRLGQVFWNLFSNAVKFTPVGGRVTARVSDGDGRVRVTVADTGEGIRPEFLPFVFDRFRQADATTTRRHGGLGLGLAIVKQLTELHGGRVRVESAGPGQGATFTVDLPLVVPGEGQPGPSSAQTVAAPPRPAVDGATVAAARATLAGVRVLAVDDEPDARAVLRRLLEDCGAVVRPAASAAEAWATLTAADAPPDVIVSDIGMPAEDGHSLMARYRRDGGRIPAVALTAFARPADRAKALAAGFDAHVAKPVDPAELVVTVAGLVRSRAESREPRAESGEPRREPRRS